MDAVELSRYGYSLLKRKEEITQKMSHPDMYFPMELMGKQAKLRCVSVRIELPVYRLANGRTRSLQLEYLALNPDKPKDLFTKDHDSFAAQYAQHQLLKQLVKEEDLFDAFKSGEREQTEPIICTDTGVVINGNRRLCAWRELYYSDPVKYKYFETISIAVLEGCDEKAIADIEKRLQILKTMRAEYHWHTKALMAKEDFEHGYKEASVAKSFDLTIKQLRTLIDARDFAAQYLISKDHENQWSIVDKKYYAFESIVTGRSRILNKNERELFEKLAFDLISDSADEVADKPSGRLYSMIKDYADNIHHIAEQLFEKLDVGTTQPEGVEPAMGIDQTTSVGQDIIGISSDAASADETQGTHVDISTNEATDEIVDSDLDLLTGGEPVAVDKASVVSATIESGADTAGIHSTIKNIIVTQKELQDEKDRAAYLVHTLSKVSGELQSAISNGLIDNVCLEGVGQQLDSIREKINRIQEWLDERK